MKRNKFGEYPLFHAVLLITLISDQVSKLLADRWLIGRRITVLPKFFFLSYTRNSGAAWSIFQGNGVLLGIIGIFVLVAIFALRKRLEIKQRSNQFAFGMICAGIAGNIIDRLSCGHVVDFIDLRLGTFCWPVFNIADASICSGIFLYFLFTILSGTRKELKIMFY
ncbi:MAG: signal peptidase II [Puniceicoccales bacterium]|nr:signal peptidase II [Puniceicoccales bacterium]